MGRLYPRTLLLLHNIEADVLLKRLCKRIISSVWDELLQSRRSPWNTVASDIAPAVLHSNIKVSPKQPSVVLFNGLKLDIQSKNKLHAVGISICLLAIDYTKHSSPCHTPPPPKKKKKRRLIPWLFWNMGDWIVWPIKLSLSLLVQCCVKIVGLFLFFRVYYCLPADAQPRATATVTWMFQCYMYY